MSPGRSPIQQADDHHNRDNHHGDADGSHHLGEDPDEHIGRQDGRDGDREDGGQRHRRRNGGSQILQIRGLSGWGIAPVRQGIKVFMGRPS